jgi:hypothetical protein
MAGKGDANRSANRAYWDAPYWKKKRKSEDKNEGAVVAEQCIRKKGSILDQE